MARPEIDPIDGHAPPMIVHGEDANGVASDCVIAGPPKSAFHTLTVRARDMWVVVLNDEIWGTALETRENCTWLGDGAIHVACYLVSTFAR
jgi:hypothetical protein